MLRTRSVTASLSVGCNEPYACSTFMVGFLWARVVLYVAKDLCLDLREVVLASEIVQSRRQVHRRLKAKSF